MGCPASSAVAGQAGQQLQVNDRAVTRRREIDHLAQGRSILAAGDNENPGLIWLGSRASSRKVQTWPVSSMSLRSALMSTRSIAAILSPDCTSSLLGFAWGNRGR